MELWEKQRVTENYWRTYNLLIRDYPRDWYFFDTYPNVKEAFLYQEPNPDYNRWLPKNCKLVFFKDWIPSHLPEGFICYRPMGRNNVQGIYKKRPVICIETGEFFPSKTAALRAYNLQGTQSRMGLSFQIFYWNGDTPYRFTLIDPFIPEEDKKLYRSYEAEHNRALIHSRGYCAQNFQYWYNNGVKETLAYTCPKGWQPGRLKQKQYSKQKQSKKPDWDW